MRADQNRDIVRFLILKLILSLPFYVLGISGAALPFASALPLSAMMASVPMIVALGLATHQKGVAAAAQLFKSAFDFRRIPSLWWVLAAVAIMPICFVLTAGIVSLMGNPLPVLHLVPPSAIYPAFTLFFLGAVAEEVGWQGYAYPRLNNQYSALKTALIIGVVWALWHVILFALMGRSAAWIIWQGAGMVCMRIIIVWLVVNTGQSILEAVLFHLVSNSVWSMFNNFDRYYNPAVLVLVLLMPVIGAVALWGPKTLKRFRYEVPT